jgi:hypothetical protein
MRGSLARYLETIKRVALVAAAYIFVHSFIMFYLAPLFSRIADISNQNPN